MSRLRFSLVFDIQINEGESIIFDNSLLNFETTDCPPDRVQVFFEPITEGLTVSLNGDPLAEDTTLTVQNILDGEVSIQHSGAEIPVEGLSIGLEFAEGDNYQYAESVVPFFISNVNDLPTGDVLASGLLIEGETLFASNTLDDEDGLGVITYQWQRNGSPISGADEASYTLTFEDVGAQISVVASYTDEKGTNEAVSSDLSALIAALNNSPEAADDEATIRRQDPFTDIAVLANDEDGDDDPLTIESVTQPANGTVLINADGTIRYTPNGSFLGEDTFTYTISDGSPSDFSTATVTVDVTDNQAPTARSGFIFVDEDSVVTFDPLLSVLASDPEGDPLTAILDFPPLNGFLTVDPVGTFTYTPNFDFSGEDLVTVLVADPFDDTPAAISIVVLPVNDAPTGDVSISGTPTEGEVLTASNTLFDADGLGPISYQWSRDGVPINDATGETYTLTADDVGAQINVVASYTDDDGTDESVASDVTTAVAAANNPPVLEEQRFFEIAEDTQASADYRNIDPDGDDASLIVKPGFEAQNGFVGINEAVLVGIDGMRTFFDGYTYTPNADFNGVDSFVVVVDDGNGGIAEQEVFITVTPVNDAPTGLLLSGSSIQENIDGALIGSLTTEDVDLAREGDSHVYDILGAVDAQGNAADDFFEIDGSSLKLKDNVSADFESSAFFDVEVQTTDSGGENFAETFRIVVEDDPRDNGLGEGFEVVSVNDWFNPAWGGGFNATFQYTIQSDDVVDDTVSAWTITPTYTGDGTITTGWSSFGPVAFGEFANGFEITTVGQGWQREATAGDVIEFSLQVLGDGFDAEDFAFDFVDEDPPVADPAAGDFSVDATTSWQWQGNFGQNVSITNGATDPSDSWTVKLDLDPGEAISITNLWGADADLVDGDWLFTAKPYNGALSPGQSASFGFNATNLNGDIVPVDPTDYEIV